MKLMELNVVEQDTMQKIGHSIIALLVFASSTFAIAPMAFCNLAPVQEEVPSCCEKPEQKPQHCTDKHADCPVCSFELCKVDPTPAKPATVHSVTPTLEFVTIPIVTLSYDYVSFVSTPARTIIDSGPPIYLLDRVFRI